VKKLAVLLLMTFALAAPTRAMSQNLDELKRQVMAAEGEFVATMAARDFAKFGTYVADEAIFFGGSGATRGKAAVLAAWKPFFDAPTPPFSWKPETVEVLQSGTLALSSGPVLNPAGERVGTFNSIWRKEPDGRWKVVFDKGS
jgi:ketosteroid isomerase-like protein